MRIPGLELAAGYPQFVKANLIFANGALTFHKVVYACIVCVYHRYSRMVLSGIVDC